MMTRQRALIATGAGLAATALVAMAIVAGTQPRTSTEIDLAGVVAEWPDTFHVEGTKSEPLYTERIEVTRAGDTFTVRIDVISQGDQALGTQLSAVHVSTADLASVQWQTGCVKAADACANDPATRGFLATSALVALEKNGELPATGTLRDLHGTTVVCVEDGDVFPNAPTAIVPLSPCFDLHTGAVLGHWSEPSAAFVGATLSAGFVVEQAELSLSLPTAHH